MDDETAAPTAATAPVQGPLAMDGDAEVLDILARETGIARERLQPEARLDELGIESLDMMQAVFALETRYDINIPLPADQTMAGSMTVAMLVVRCGNAFAHQAGQRAAEHGRGAAGRRHRAWRPSRRSAIRRRRSGRGCARGAAASAPSAMSPPTGWRSGPPRRSSVSIRCSISRRDGWRCSIAARSSPGRGARGLGGGAVGGRRFSRHALRA